MNEYRSAVSTVKCTSSSLHGFYFFYVVHLFLLLLLHSWRHWREDTRPRLRERAHPHEAREDVARPLDHGLARVAQPPWLGLGLGLGLGLALWLRLGLGLG